MKIINAKVQGFKRIVFVDVTPDDPLVRVNGNNAEGKSSLLDAIKAALGGGAAAPVKPVRTGEDFAAIRIELGDGKPDIVVEKYFDEVGEKLKVTTADGAEFKAGQTKVDELLGRMTFDPLAFARMNATDQAVELRRIAPLSIDLDALAAADKADKLARRDVNRDGKALVNRLEAIAVEADLPEERPDLDALTATLASAADTNAAITREETTRADAHRANEGRESAARGARDEAAALRERADALDKSAAGLEGEIAAEWERLAALPPLDTLVDTTAARQAIDDARALLTRFARKDARDALSVELEEKRGESRAYTNAIEARAEERRKALAAAEMPVPGLALARVADVVPGEESDDLIVTYEGEPFSQASGAQQLRVSMRLAMAANPRLRVMLIKEGSLLDPNGLALVRDLAAEGDYQVWLESVGEGDGTGLIMEAGTVRGAPEGERLTGPKRRKPRAEADAVAEPSTGKAHAGEVDPGKVTQDAAELSRARSPIPGDAAQTAAPEPAEPVRRKRAMREFTSAPAGGDLFGREGK